MKRPLLLVKTQTHKSFTTTTSLFAKLFLLACLITSSSQAFATIRYVKQNASGNGNGTTWGNASSDLQAIINTSGSGDEIWVAKGTYKPTVIANTGPTPENRDKTFLLKTGVKIYGGFAGTENALAERNLRLPNASILSGDLGNNDTSDPATYADNAFHVALVVNTGGFLDGFTVTGGNTDDGHMDDPTYRDVIVNGEHVYDRRGAGIMVNTPAATSTFNNLKIIGNKAGRGISVTRYTPSSSNIQTSISNTVISGNTGGGIAVSYLTLTLTNVTVSGNLVTLSWENGSGILLINASCKFRNTIIYNNGSENPGDNLEVWVLYSLTPEISYSLLAGVTTNSETNKSGSTDPLFVNSVAPGLSKDGDYRLKSTSTLINIGANSFFNFAQTPDLSAFTTDLTGTDRKSGGTADIGAYEFTTIPNASGTVFVKQNGTGSGSSWDDAIGDLQAAINTTGVQQIWVAKGTYKPNRRADATGAVTNGDRDNAFVLKNGAQLYGGFAGTEATLSERNLSIPANASILSGDLGDNDAGGTITDNAYHIVVLVQAGGVLDGFRITGGNATGNGNINVSGVLNDASVNRGTGGGILLNNTTQSSFNNLIISGNQAQNGGGLASNAGAASALTNTVISGNLATNQGGGMYLSSRAPILTNVTISGNKSPSGGGIRTDYLETLVLLNTVIYGNDGGGVSLGEESGINYQNSLIQGITSTSGTNIGGDVDPLFLYPRPASEAPTTAGEYNILSCSPLANKGNNNLMTLGFDIAGNPRIRNGVVEIGAYELTSDPTILPQGSLIAGNPVCPDQLGQLTFTATAGIGPFNLVINDQAYNNVTSGTAFNTISIVSVSSVFTLNAITTTGGGCFRTTGITGNSATIVVKSAPQGNLTAGNPICTDQPGQLTFTSTAGTGPFSLTINSHAYDNVTSGTAFNTISALSESNQFIISSLTGANGCSRTTNITGNTAEILVKQLPQGDLTASAVSGSLSALFIYTATDGTGPFSLVIEGATYDDVASGAAFNVPITAGSRDYYLTSVTGTSGCSRTFGFNNEFVTVTSSLGVWYVKSGGTGDGLTWETASGDLQNVINMAGPGDQIFVAKGTYKPNRLANNLTGISLNDRNNAFVLKKGVKIYGGFAGTEGSVAQRNLALTDNASILSGDFIGNDQGIIGNNENSYRVVISAGDVGSAVLDGFTITGGYNGFDDPEVTVNSQTFSEFGGGIALVSSSPNLVNLIIKGNYGASGGGIGLRDSSPIITNTAISGNAARKGGAIYTTGSSAPVLTNILISGNSAFGQGGGAIFNESAGEPVLTNVTISGNSTDGAGSILNSNSSLKIRNSIISGNDKDIVNETATVEIKNSLVQGNTDLTNGNVNADIDPMFIAPADHTLAPTDAGDYRLQRCTVLNDAGSNTFYESGQITDLQLITTDLARNYRFLYGGNTDLGAYEQTALVSPEATGIIYVKAGASGTGVSWDCAFGDLQAAMQGAAIGSQVWVAKGTYQRGIGQSFTMKEGVKVYGGFAGTEATLQERDLRQPNQKSILQGNGTDVIANDNNNLTAAALLDGFTITGGSSTILYRGTGVMNSHSSPSFQNCSITGNNPFNGSGGGVNLSSSDSQFTNCIISNNSASIAGGVFLGGGYASFINCTISNNTASNNAGGVFILTWAELVTFTNCIITGNKSPLAGGIEIYRVNDGTNVSLTNVTLSGNSNYAIYQTSGVPKMRNCIVFGNEFGISTGNYPESPATIQNCLVQERNSALNGNISGGTNPLFVSPVDHTSAPTAVGDYRLQVCSPAINAGSNAIYDAGQIPELSGIVNDLDGNIRKKGISVDMGAYEFMGGNDGNPGAADLLAINGDEASGTVSGSTTLTAEASDCRTVAVILPDNSATSVTGIVNAKVWVESTQPLTFVKRHYEITPGAGSAAATGKVSLFFTQQEFTDFNAVNATKLPVDPADAANNKANILIEKRAGESSDGSGLPASYTGSVSTINLLDLSVNGSIVWNNGDGRWEVSFDVVGFSGFFIKTTSNPLPLHLLSFTASRETGSNKLQWVTTNEVNTKNFELQSSADARNFTKIALIEAATTGNNTYNYNDPSIYQGNVYYRLKMSDRAADRQDGTFTYSRIIWLNIEGNNFSKVYPNPASAFVKISVSPNLMNTRAKLYDISGRLIQTIVINSDEQQINIRPLTSGLYIVHFEDGTVDRFVKE